MLSWGTAAAQNECVTQSIIVNTGYNPLNGTVYPTGEVDGYWYVVEDKDQNGANIGTVPRCANVIDADPVWSPAQSGSQWIASQPTYAGNSRTTIFERRFCIGVLTHIPDLTVSLSVLAADSADIYLNGGLIASIPNYGAVTPTPVNVITGVVSGLQTLRVVLHDAGGSGSGLDIIGTVSLPGAWMVPDSCCARPCEGADCSTQYLAFGTDETWTLLEDPSGGIVPRCASQIPNPYSNWGPAIPGSSWIGPNSTGSTTLPGVYVFQKKFEVSHATTIQLKLLVMADDAVDVYLDNIHILNYPNWAGSIPKKLDQLFLLQPGCHSLTFHVNDINAVATGLDAFFEVIGEGLVRDQCSSCGACPDCGTEDMRLSTNSNWTIVQDPSGWPVPRCASEIPNLPSGWGPALPGSSWIGPNPTGSAPVNGRYVFERRFQVSKATTINVSLLVMADDAVDVFLDGVHLLNYPNWAGSIPAGFDQNFELGPGCHTLRFEVHNQQGIATGLDAIVDLIGDGLIEDECSECGSCSPPLLPVPFLSDAPDVSLAGSRMLKVSPNPSAGAVNAQYTLGNRAETRLELYDPSGKLVMTLDAGEQGPGEYMRSYMLENLPAGLYFLQLTAGDRRSLAPVHLRD